MATIHSIQQFIGSFNGGTRPNRFRISGTSPTENGQTLFPETLCTASSIPESIIGSIPIPFRGRIYKFPGDRVYNDWTVTMHDDTEKNAVWGFWHDWSQKFNSHENNTASDRRHVSNFCVDLSVEHLDHQTEYSTKVIRLLNAWPIQVGPIALDMAAANQLSQFQVQIAYTHYTYQYPAPAPVSG